MAWRACSLHLDLVKQAYIDSEIQISKLMKSRLSQKKLNFEALGIRKYFLKVS
jgi:hypothetical protein